MHYPPLQYVTEVHSTSSSANVSAISVNPRTDRQRRQHVDRTIAALYRWYVAKSQPRRAWNADTDFRWKEIRTDLPEDILKIVQGFFAVEQFIPDYAVELTSLVRRNYGRSQFYLNWGAEEAKHADLWQNVLLATGYRDREWIEDYCGQLRDRSWELPFDDPLEMLVYTVFQERATQVNYVKLRKLVSEDRECLDPVLAEVARQIAIDEVAHFEFFLAATQVYLYYFPERTLNAILRVLKYFEMPAADIVSDYGDFIKALYARQVFGKRTYAKDVVRLVCDRLAVRDPKELARKAKLVRKSSRDGLGVATRPQDIFDFEIVQNSVITLFKRIERYEHVAGIERFASCRMLDCEWRSEL